MSTQSRPCGAASRTAACLLPLSLEEAAWRHLPVTCWAPRDWQNGRSASSREEAGNATFVFHSVARQCFVLWLHRLCGV